MAAARREQLVLEALRVDADRRSLHGDATHLVELFVAQRGGRHLDAVGADTMRRIVLTVGGRLVHLELAQAVVAVERGRTSAEHVERHGRPLARRVARLKTIEHAKCES